jgi:hypothetical protein
MEMDREGAQKNISDCFRKESASYSNLIQISGKFLIQHNLVESWAYLRNINPDDITDKWADHITLYQAQVLGLLDFVLDAAPYIPRPRGTVGGRKPGLSAKARQKASTAAELYRAGNMPITEIMDSLEIRSKATLYRYLRLERAIV